MFLGVDQSLRSTGVSAITEQGDSAHLGRIVPKKLTDVHRLASIRDELRRIICALPDIRFAAIEGYAYDVTAGRVFELGEVGATVKLVLHDIPIPFVVVPPTCLKQFAVGNGSASKEQVRLAVEARWGKEIPQDDECDAYVLSQIARSYCLNQGRTRWELEVLKKLRDAQVTKDPPLVSFKGSKRDLL